MSYPDYHEKGILHRTPFFEALTHLSVLVAPFRAYHTDLPRYHTFPSLHPSATFIMHDSV